MSAASTFNNLCSAGESFLLFDRLARWSVSTQFVRPGSGVLVAQTRWCDHWCDPSTVSLGGAYSSIRCSAAGSCARLRSHSSTPAASSSPPRHRRPPSDPGTVVAAGAASTTEVTRKSPSPKRLNSPVSPKDKSSAPPAADTMLTPRGLQCQAEAELMTHSSQSRPKSAFPTTARRGKTRGIGTVSETQRTGPRSNSKALIASTIAGTTIVGIATRGSPRSRAEWCPSVVHGGLRHRPLLRPGPAPSTSGGTSHQPITHAVTRAPHSGQSTQDHQKCSEA